MTRVIIWTAVSALLVAGTLFLLSGTFEIVVYELILIVMAIVGLMALRPPNPTPEADRVWWNRTARNLPPPQLEALERVVRFGTSTALDADRRLYRRLRDIAAELLLVRYGVDIDAEPDEAEALLGSFAWDRLRPDRRAADDRAAPGADLDEVREIVDAIQRL